MWLLNIWYRATKIDENSVVKPRTNDEKFIQDVECYKCRYNVMPCWICSYLDTEDNYCICVDRREVID